MILFVIVVGIPIARIRIPSVTDDREDETQDHHRGRDQEDDQTQLATGVAPGLGRQPAEHDTDADEPGVPHPAAS
jgi:hypothetical protein